MHVTGETPEQRRTRELLQLENYHYCRKEGISDLPMDMRVKILEDMSKVSFEALRALPMLHKEKMTVAQWYDWLHCAGYANDERACEYVDEFIRKRKERSIF
jgi:hypothetical protein